MAAIDAAAPAVTAPTALTDLSVDILGSIAALLEPRDIISLGACCSKASVLLNEEVWEPLCQRQFVQTRTSQWLASSSHQLHRLLYPVLARHAQFVGVWQNKAAAGHAGALFSFRWAPSGVDVCQLVPARRFLTAISHRKLCTLGPAHPRYQSEVVDGTKLILRDLGSCPPSAMTCAAAAAATCVAAGDAVMGSSPGSGFCAELLRFMHTSVGKTRSSRRSRRSGGGCEVSPPVLHCFDRVVLRHSARHPLEGLWKGLYGPHGCELLAIRYDLSGPSARIVATKMTGDTNVPAGEVSWHAAAAALPEPLPAEEQQLLLARPELLARHIVGASLLAAMDAGAAGAAIPAAPEQDAPQQGEQQDLSQAGGNPGAVAVAAGGGGGGSGLQAAQAQQSDVERLAAWAARLKARRVIRVMRGQGQMPGPGFTEPYWVEGRLWVCEDPASRHGLSCGFVFMQDERPLLLIELERLEPDL